VEKTKVLKSTLLDLDNLRQKHYEDTTALEGQVKALSAQNSALLHQQQ